MCGHCQAGRITGSSLLVLLFPSVPPKAPSPLQIPIFLKKFFWKEKWDEPLPFLPSLVLWGLNPHLSGTCSHPLTSSFNINIYTLPWWLTGHTNLRFFFFNAKKFHWKEKCMMLSTFAPIILKIAWHFITPASLGRLFELSGQSYFWKIKVENCNSKLDSVLQQILTTNLEPDFGITAWLYVLS